MSDLSRLGVTNPADWQGVVLKEAPATPTPSAKDIVTQFPPSNTTTLEGIGLIPEQHSTVLPKATPMEVLGASMFGMARSLYAAYEEDQQGFDKDPAYNPISYTAELTKTLGNLSEDENRALLRTRSKTHADWRVQRILDERMRSEVQSQNIAVSLGGSLLDADTLLGLGVAKAASSLPKVYQVSKLRTALGASAGAAGVTYGLTSDWEADTRSESQKLIDAAVLGLSFGLGIKTARSLKTGAKSDTALQSTDGASTPQPAGRETTQPVRNAPGSVLDGVPAPDLGYPTREVSDALTAQNRGFPEGVQKTPQSSANSSEILDKFQEFNTYQDSIQELTQTLEGLEVALKEHQATRPVHPRELQSRADQAQAAYTKLKRKLKGKSSPELVRLQEQAAEANQRWRDSIPLGEAYAAKANEYRANIAAVHKQLNSVKRKATKLKEQLKTNPKEFEVYTKQRTELKATQELNKAEDAVVDADVVQQGIHVDDDFFVPTKTIDVIEVQDELGTVRYPVRDAVPPANSAEAIRRYARRTQAGSTRLKQYLSTVDKLAFFGSKADKADWETIQNLMPDAAFSRYDTALNKAALIQRKGYTALNTVDQSIADAAVQYYGSKGRFGSLNPIDSKATLQIEREIQTQASKVLRKLYSWEKQLRHMDEPIEAADIAREVQRLSPNQGIANVVQSYIDSGFAELHLDALKRSGVKGAEQVLHSKTYTPLRWDYGKMLQAMQNGLPREQLARMFGTDLAQRFPDLLTHGRTVDNIGEEFLRTQEQAKLGMYDQAMSSTRDTVEAMLRNFGVGADEIQSITDRMFQQVDEAGKPRFLKRRNDWDFNKVYVANGQKYTLGDFANDNLMENLRSYNSTSSHRAGLASYGIQGESDLTTLWQRVLRNLPTGVDPRTAKEFFDELNNQLLGRPVGGNAPEFMRVTEAVAYALNMSNSGLYNLMDGTLIAMEVGLARTVKHTIKTMPDVFKAVANLTPKEAQRLKDVLAADVLAESRLQKVVTHLEDMYAMQFNTSSHWVHRAAQSVKFLNGSEFIRRWQVHTIASAYEDVLEQAVRNPDGVAGQVLRKIGMTSEDIKAIGSAIDQYGLYINKWPVGIAERAQQLIQGSIDNTVLHVHKGEAPAFLEHTVTGKVIFPYMKYAMAGNQKILRRTYNSGGASAVAQLMFMQATLAPVLAAAINVTNGRTWDKDIEIASVRASTSLGYFSIAADAFMSGGMKSSAAVFSPLNSTFQLGRALTGDEEPYLYDVTNTLPFMGVSVLNMGLGVLKSVQEQDKQDARKSRELNSAKPALDY